MEKEEKKLAEAVAALTVEDVEWLQENGMIAEVAADSEKPAHCHVTISQQEAASQETTPAKKTREMRSEETASPNQQMAFMFPDFKISLDNSVGYQ